MDSFDQKPAPTQPLPFEFRGTATQYFGIWIVNILLMILTLGIYTAWAKVRTKRYFYGNTLLAGSPFDYLASPVAILKGWAIAIVVLLVYNILTGVFPMAAILLLPIILIGTPWVVVRSLRFRARNSAWRNIRFGFRKAYAEAAKVFILYPVFIMLTLGLFMPYYYYAISRFMVDNSGYGTTPFRFHARARDYYKVFIWPMLLMMVAIIGILAAIAIPAYHHYKQQAEDMMLQQQQGEQMHMDETVAADELSMQDETLQMQDDMAAMSEAELLAQENADMAAPGEQEPITAEEYNALMQEAMAELERYNAEMERMEGLPEEETYGQETLEDVLPEGSGDDMLQEQMTDMEAAMQNELQQEMQPDEMQTGVYDDATAPADDAQTPPEFDALAGTLSLVFILLGFLVYFGFLAYIQTRVYNLFYNNTELAGHRFKSSLRARDIVWLYLSNIIVIALTFGLMIPWAKVRMARYRTSKMQLLPAGDLDSFLQAQQEKVSALGEELGEAFDLDIGI